jgi:hypothetical protein
VNGVRQVHELRGEYIGPGMVHLEMHVAVAPGTSIEDAVGSLTRCKVVSRPMVGASIARFTLSLTVRTSIGNFR